MEETRQNRERWVRTWKDAGPALETIRLREIIERDHLQAIADLESAFDFATRTLPSRTSSGMVEMQRLFALLPR